MSVRDKLIKEAQKEIELREHWIRQSVERLRLIEAATWLDIEVSRTTIPTLGLGTSIAFQCYGEPGDGQELANNLATEFGIEFEKSFMPNYGEHRYIGEYEGLGISISGAPPKDCKLVKKVEMTEVVSYEVECE